MNREKVLKYVDLYLRDKCGVGDVLENLNTEELAEFNDEVSRSGG